MRLSRSSSSVLLGRTFDIDVNSLVSGSGQVGDLAVIAGGGRYSAMHTAAGVVALLGSFTASNMRTALGADATGTGPAVFADSPSLTTQATLTRSAIGTSQMQGVVAQNTTPAANGNQQNGPILSSIAQGFASTPGNSQPVEFGWYTASSQGTANPGGAFVMGVRVNNGAWSTPLNISTGGTISTNGGATFGNSVTVSSGSIQASAGAFITTSTSGAALQCTGVTNIRSFVRIPPARVSSTGGGAQTISSIALTTGVARRFRGTIVGVKSDGSVSYSYTFVATGICPSGTTSVVATVTADAGSATTTTAPTITASTNNINFVSGDTAATTIRWTVSFNEDLELTAA